MAENNNDQVGRLPKTPHPGVRRLEPLIGRWRIAGPDVEGELVYEWMEGGFFFIQRFDLGRDASEPRLCHVCVTFHPPWA
jgi:hypothetical protein